MPKRIAILILALILTLGLAVDANAGYKTLIKTGTVTLDNCRISYVAGTAFIDGSDILTSYLGHWVELVADGKRVAGVVKAAGGGETLGAAKTVVGITKANPGVITFSAGHGLSNGMVIKFVDLTEMTELNGKYRVLTNNSGDTFQIGDTSSFAAAETTGGACANQVTVPAATGVTIVTQFYGSTYNFNSVETAFDPNYTTGFTYSVYSTGSKIAASGSVSAGSAKMDITTSNAFADFGSVLATYAGSDTGIRRYQLIVIDSAGKIFRAWIGAAGSGASYDADLLWGWNLNIGWSKKATTTIDDTNRFTTGGNESSWVYKSILTSGGCYKGVYNGTSSASLDNKVKDSNLSTIYVADGATSYFTALTSGWYILHSSTTTGQYLDIITQSCERLTEPASTGVHLFSTPGYSTHTRSYASMDSGFNPNYSLTYKIVDTQPDLGELVYTTTIAAGSLKADTTDTNAFCDWGSTVPLSGFAGVDGYTPYLLVLQDGAGKIKYGYVSVADSGEELAAAKDVDGITKANPGVVTYAAGHGYSNGQVIYFSGLTEMTELNTKYRTLMGNVGDTFTINDTSAYGAAETTGGNCSQNLTHCATTGCLIVSTKNGSTRAWAGGDSTFNPNLAVIVRVYKAE